MLWPSPRHPHESNVLDDDDESTDASEDFRDENDTVLGLRLPSSCCQGGDGMTESNLRGDGEKALSSSGRSAHGSSSNEK